MYAHTSHRQEDGRAVERDGAGKGEDLDDGAVDGALLRHTRNRVDTQGELCIIATLNLHRGGQCNTDACRHPCGMQLPCDTWLSSMAVMTGV